MLINALSLYPSQGRRWIWVVSFNLSVRKAGTDCSVISPNQITAKVRWCVLSVMAEFPATYKRLLW
jgi:hypothetical protein